MQRTWLLALVGALALGLATPSYAQTPPSTAFFPFPMKVDRLPNGLTVVRAPFHSPNLVAFYTLVRVGSRNEVEPGHTGFAHFFEHVMFKGTKKYPGEAREKKLGALGFLDNAYTTDDFTVYHLTGPTSALALLVELEADRFQNLTYGEQTFQTEAKAVLGEYHKSASSPWLKLEEELSRTAYTHHPYQHTTLGFYDDIKKMPDYYQYSLEFFRRWYTPDNTTLFVSGDFDDAQLMSLVQQHYGPWQAKVAEVAIPAEPPQRQERIAKVEFPGATLPIHLHAWHAPPATLATPDAAVQDVLAAYLVSEVSELHKDLVLKRQIAQDLFTWYYPHRDSYLFSIGARFKKEQDRAQVKKAFDVALKSLVTGRIDAKRVEAIKSHKRYALLMSLQTSSEVANELARFTGAYGSPQGLEHHYQSIAKVTPANLQTFAKRNMTARNRTQVQLTAKPAAAEAKP